MHDAVETLVPPLRCSTVVLTSLAPSVGDRRATHSSSVEDQFNPVPLVKKFNQLKTKILPFGNESLTFKNEM